MKIVSIAANEPRFYGRTQMEMLDWYKKKCREVSSQKPDIVIFPEMQLWMYPREDPMSYDEFYPVSVEEMCKAARQLGSYIVYSVYEPHDTIAGMYHNTALFISRSGEVIGKYRKIHTVDNESLEHNIVPGTDLCVVDTEFGRIGLVTCFDIGWRHMWQQLEDMGAKAVIWTAAYDGGNLLDAYAVTHMYWVITSVRTYRARVIDPVGRTVAESARWDDLCICDIDLDTEIFHIDNQHQKIDAVRAELGENVEIHTRSEENVFTLSSKDPAWPISRIKEEFGLVTYREYHAAAEELQKEWTEKYMKCSG